MRVERLELENVGPFREAAIDFATEAPRVTLLTGENGTGKTAILDAIRLVFGEHFCKDVRNILGTSTDFRITLRHTKGTETFRRSVQGHLRPHSSLQAIPFSPSQGLTRVPWIADYWTSLLSSDPFEMVGLERLNPERHLFESLSGIHPNKNVTRALVFFDYLRDSRDPQERHQGEVLYGLMERIVAASLLEGGRLSHVSRSTFEPILQQNGADVRLSQISSGNLYLIQRLTSLAEKMYAVHVLNGTALSEIHLAPGLLLIDEAENHLHPKWQQRFLTTVLDLFPNLQVIATTHSPFIVSSLEGARVWVCKARGDHCVVEDETEAYAHRSVEEVLLSEAFGGTWPFGREIRDLLAQRSRAIQAGDQERRRSVESRLLELNPQYFGFLDLDTALESLGVPG